MADRSVSTRQLTARLTAAMADRQLSMASRLAAGEALLCFLLLPDCPLYSVFDSITGSSLVDLLRSALNWPFHVAGRDRGTKGRRTVAGDSARRGKEKAKDSGGGRGKGATGWVEREGGEGGEGIDACDEEREEDGIEHFPVVSAGMSHVLRALSRVLDVLSLQEQPDTRKSLVEVMVEATRHAWIEAAAGEGGRRKGASRKGGGGDCDGGKDGSAFEVLVKVRDLRLAPAIPPATMPSDVACKQ